MKSYRDQYDEFVAQRAHIIVVSADKEATQGKFRAAIGATFSFVSDTRAELIHAFAVGMPLVKAARRVTFVIGKDRKILQVDKGAAALDPSGAAQACRLY